MHKILRSLSVLLSLAPFAALAQSMASPAPEPAVTEAPAAAAQPPSAWRFGVDSDPSMFALGGFSGWVMAKPARSQLRFGAGLFSLEVPGAVLGVLDTAGTGFQMRLTGYMAHGGYFLSSKHSGLYLGGYIGMLQTSYQDPTLTTERANLFHVTVMPEIGYQWFPVHNGALRGLYLQPWLGVSFWIPVGGTASIGTKTFDEPIAVPFPALHLGYEF